MVLDKSFPLLWPQSPPPPPMPHPQPGHSCWCVCLGTAACLPGRPLTAVEVEDLQTRRDIWPMETSVSALLSLPALSPWSGRALDFGLRILGTYAPPRTRLLQLGRTVGSRRLGGLCVWELSLSLLASLPPALFHSSFIFSALSSDISFQTPLRPDMLSTQQQRRGAKCARDRLQSPGGAAGKP